MPSFGETAVKRFDNTTELKLDRGTPTPATRVMTENAVEVANELKKLKEKIENDAFKRENERLKKENEQLRKANTELLRRSRTVQTTKGPAPSQDADIESMKHFLRTYDELSSEDVIQKLDQINNLVEGIALQLAHRWVLDRKPEDRSFDMSLTADKARGLERALGTALYKQMCREDQSYLQNDMILQLGWQACILFVVSEISSLFSIASPGVLDDPKMLVDTALVKLGGTVFLREAQPSYSRWRTITYQSLKDNLAPEERSRKVKSLKDACTEICYHAAVQVFKTDSPDHAVFAGSCEDELEEIVAETIRFIDAVKEGIASGDYIIVAPQPGEPFLGDRMVPEDNQPADRNDVVCCTTQLGLEFRSKPRGSPSPGSGAAKTTVLKKAVVVTEKYIHKLLPRLAHYREEILQTFKSPLCHSRMKHAKIYNMRG